MRNIPSISSSKTRTLSTAIFGAILTCVLPAPAARADCPAGQYLFLSCKIEDRPKYLQVCFDEQAMYYTFGPQNGPAELTLSETYDTLDYTPWPGVGRAIWESVSFTNQDFTYTVYGGFDRMFGDETEDDHPHPHFGSLTVTQGEQTIAELTCDRTTTTFSWPEEIFGHKEAAGFEWDYSESSWKPRP